MRYEKNKEVDPWLRSVLIDVRHKYKSCSLISSSIKKDDLFDKKLNIPEKESCYSSGFYYFFPNFSYPNYRLISLFKKINKFRQFYFNKKFVCSKL